MAQPAPPCLQGTDPALIAILNRMENKDSTPRSSLCFLKQTLTVHLNKLQRATG